MHLFLDVLRWTVTTLGFAGLVIGLLASAITVLDLAVSRRVSKSVALPVRIRRSIRFRDYIRALDRFALELDAKRSIPDCIVGIHYGGISCAADIARRWYKPVFLIETRFELVNGIPVCRQVRPKFSLPTLRGKTVLLVDNGIRSGGTLKMAQDILVSVAKSVDTLVIFRSGDGDRLIDATYTLFYSKRRLTNLLR
jgi:adenine/guanine phosphoribosyltransferase-like PRPP-binding protein